MRYLSCNSSLPPLAFQLADCNCPVARGWRAKKIRARCAWSGYKLLETELARICLHRTCLRQSRNAHAPSGQHCNAMTARKRRSAFAVFQLMTIFPQENVIFHITCHALNTHPTSHTRLCFGPVLFLCDMMQTLRKLYMWGCPVLFFWLVVCFWGWRSLLLVVVLQACFVFGGGGCFLGLAFRFRLLFVLLPCLALCFPQGWCLLALSICSF